MNDLARIRTCLMIGAMLVPCVCMAQDGVLQATEFFRKIVASDFEGDAFPRIGNVLPSRCATRGCTEFGDVAPRPEAYFLDSDPLVVARDWELIAVRPNFDGACAVFKFSIVARSRGQGLPSWRQARHRHFSVQDAGVEAVSYCAVVRNGRWMLLDPPIPRVSLARVLQSLRDSRATTGKAVTLPSHADPRAVLNARRISDALTEQIEVLSSLE